MSWSTAPLTLGTPADNRKLVAEGTHRVALLEDTLARITAKARAFGLTRIADLTDLDVLGIPSVAAICPGLNWPPADGCISVLSGKGITTTHAKVSALMEAAEHWSGRHRADHLVHGSARQLSTLFNIAHPSAFVMPGTCDIDDDEPIEWVAARSLVRHDVVLVPAFLVYIPYRSTDPELRELGGSSNGLASGNTLAEATAHALYELIERDAEAIALHTGQARAFDLASVAGDPEIGPLLERFDAAGIQLVVKEITQDIAVPTFLAVIVDPSLPSVEYLNGGKGTHLDPRVALCRAITEAAQSRLVIMAGIREDMAVQRAEMADDDFDAMLARFPEWFADRQDGPAVSITQLADQSTDSILEDLRHLVDAVTAAGLEDVLVVDLTRPELDIPVARVLVPGFEFHIPGNWCGPRLAARLAERQEVRS